MTGRCVDKACTDGPRDHDEQPAPRWATLGNLCARCSDHLEQRIAELPAQQQQVRACLGGLRSNTNDGSRRTKGNPPMPMNPTAFDHLEQLHATVVGWTRIITEERGLRGPDRNDVAHLGPWLLSQHDWICGQPWVDDMADELRDLQRAADGITRARPQQHRLPAPCPTCDQQQLTRWDGADHVTCGSCGRTWTEHDYARLVLVLASDRGTSITAPEAAKRAGVPASTFRRWVGEGHIRRLGTVGGQARYSTLDLDAHTQQETA